MVRTSAIRRLDGLRLWPHRSIRVELSPAVVAAVAVFTLLLFGWSAAVTSYALFRDDFLHQLRDSYSANSHAQRAEIARLEDELQRLSSQRMVERAGYSERLAKLSQRQSRIETRQTVLASFAESPSPAIENASFSLGSAPAAAVPQPRPAGIAVDHEVRLGTAGPLHAESRGLPEANPDLPSPDIVHADGRTAALDGKLGQVEKRQKDLLAHIKRALERDRDRLQGVYRELGLRRTASDKPVQASIGGPFVPVDGLDIADPFDRQLAQTALLKSEVDRLRADLAGIPLRNPAPGAPESSGFGTRKDPFLGTLAMHTGLDLRMDAGTPVKATAAGKITLAGWEGGYGYMVEVDHGRGLTSRYAHLSSIKVDVGQNIASGQVVGTVGSTGRSTGPHLHYETRIDGNPVNPKRFIAVGQRLEDEG